ncbi:MAG: hypothetical protein QGH15_17870 [Kiritimatiellia bacterium]|jgi:hypothetical protein|nr:hypothetical protein [Kiritimatiellia bacterium]
MGLLRHTGPVFIAISIVLLSRVMSQADDLIIPEGTTQTVSGTLVYETGVIDGTLELQGNTSLTFDWGLTHTNLPPTNVLVFGENARIRCRLEDGEMGTPGEDGASDQGAPGTDGTPGLPGPDSYDLSIEVHGNILCRGNITVYLAGMRGGWGGDGGDGSWSYSSGGDGGNGNYGAPGGDGGTFALKGHGSLASDANGSYFQVDCSGGLGGYGGSGGDGGSATSTNGVNGGAAGTASYGASGGEAGAIVFQVERIENMRLYLDAMGGVGGRGGLGGFGGSYGVQGTPGGASAPAGNGGTIQLITCSLVRYARVRADGGTGGHGSYAGGPGFGGNIYAPLIDGLTGGDGEAGGMGGFVDLRVGFVRTNILVSANGGSGGKGGYGGPNTYGAGGDGYIGSRTGDGGDGSNGGLGGTVSVQIYQGTEYINMSSSGGAGGEEGPPGYMFVYPDGQLGSSGTPGRTAHDGEVSQGLVDTITDCGCGVVVYNLFVDDGAYPERLVYKGANDITEIAVEVINDSTNAASGRLNISMPDIPVGKVLKCFSVSNLDDRVNMSAGELPCLLDTSGPDPLYLVDTGSVGPKERNRIVLRFQMTNAPPGQWPISGWVHSNDAVEAGLDVVQQAGGIIVANRNAEFRTWGDKHWSDLLYGFGSSSNKAARHFELLRDVAENNDPGEMDCVIYYADLYDDDIAAWEGSSEDLYSNPSEVNKVPDKLRGLIQRWANALSGGGAPNVVLFGGDFILPFYRYYDEGDFELNNTRPWSMLCNLHGYIWSDLAYGDLEGGYGGGGGVECSVGRVFASRHILKSREGVTGPSKAVVCSGPSYQADHIVSTLSDAGYEIRFDGGPSNTVESGTWGTNVLSAAMNPGFRYFFYGDHASHESFYHQDGTWTHPNDLYGMIPSNSSPLVVLGGCHGAGMDELEREYWIDGSMTEASIGKYSSGVLGSSGLSYSGGLNRDGSPRLGYTELMYNNFFHYLGEGYTVGDALRRSCYRYTRHRSAINLLDRHVLAGMLYFGFPWMQTDLGGSGGTVRGHTVPSRQNLNISVSQESAGWRVTDDVAEPKAVHTVELTFPVTDYSVVSTNGYEVIHIPGTDEMFDHGRPVTPAFSSVLRLPPDADGISCRVVSSNAVDLGAVDLPFACASPTIDPKSPATNNFMGITGTYPGENCTVTVQGIEDHIEVSVHLAPVRHDTTSRQTTLWTNTAVEIEYTTSLSLLISELIPDLKEYHPGDSGHILATVENAGASMLSGLQAEVRIIDLGGTVVAQSTSGVFSVSSGGMGALDLPLAVDFGHGNYAVHMDVLQGGTTQATARTRLSVREGKVTAWSVPSEIHQGESNLVLSADFMCYGNQPAKGNLLFRLFDGAGLERLAFHGSARDLLPGTTNAITARWEACYLPLGFYNVHLVVQSGDVRYGPFESEIEMKRPLPKVLWITPYSSEFSYTAPADILMEVDAWSPSGTVSEVTFRSSSGAEQAVTSEPFSWTWTGVAGGYHTLQAEALDDEGARAYSEEISVLVTNLNPDLNENGIPDVWEWQHGLNVTSNSDADADGYLDRFEYLAGTDPTNSADLLYIMSVGKPGPYGGILVEWHGVFGQYYEVDRSTNITVPSSFETLFAFPRPMGEGGLSTYEDFEPTTGSNLYYRIRTDRNWGQFPDF